MNKADLYSEKFGFVRASPNYQLPPPPPHPHQPEDHHPHQPNQLDHHPPHENPPHEELCGTTVLAAIAEFILLNANGLSKVPS